VGDRTNFAIAALRRLRETDADVIHVHLPFAANVLVTIAPWLRDRLVYTAHLGELRMDALMDEATTGDGSDDLDVPSILSRVSPDGYLARRAAATTVLNAAIERQFIERGVPAAKLSTIPNGVDSSRFAPIAETELDRVRSRYDLGDGPVTLFVGTIMPRKGILDLVRAWDGADADGTLVLAGEADLDEEYTACVRAEARERGIEGRVRLTGFVPADDVPPLYSLADLFVLPSLEEGFGMTVLEAMTAGTPVVATRVGGVPRVIDDGEQGLLVEAGEVGALSKAITSLLDDRDRSQRMGRQAQCRAEAYSWRSVGKEFISVYRTVEQ
jgi:glycosyltransferase involved in cell wall biosynthesis